jgi:hypothetical protein
MGKKSLTDRITAWGQKHSFIWFIIFPTILAVAWFLVIFFWLRRI